MLGDGDRHTLWIELADDRPRDFAQDRELRDPERRLHRLAPRRFLELAGLGREMPHFLHEPRDLPAGAEVRLAAQESAMDDVLEILTREGLDEVLEGAVGQRVPHGLQRGVCRDHHHFDRGVGPLDVTEELEPIHLRHLDVHDHDVGLKPPQQVEGRASVLGRLDLVSGFQQHAERFARTQLVVDDEHACERGGRRAHEVASGSVTRKWSSCRPCRTVNWPPTASTRRWLTAGPTSIRLS